MSRRFFVPSVYIEACFYPFSTAPSDLSKGIRISNQISTSRIQLFPWCLARTLLIILFAETNCIKEVFRNSEYKICKNKKSTRCICL